MPLASSGVFASIGREALASARNNIPHARAIHLNARSAQPASTVQHLLRQTRTLFSAFVGHLTTPGAGRFTSARSLHHLTRGQSIQSGLSNSARFALARPLGAPKLPYPPSVPRSVVQVGLGTARKFSTARPIFAHLAENVPVAGRALVEADWELRIAEERSRFMKERENAQKEEAKRIAAEKVAFHPAASVDAPTEPETTAAELEHYFPTPATPAKLDGVTTTLLIPLAPTPSSRLPLSSLPKTTNTHPIVPFAEMSTLHYDFLRHNERVAALFEKLDQADVWSAGAQCAAYGDMCGGGANVLRVSFDGWDAKRVRALIGETGAGWCMLEEERALDDAELDEVLDSMIMTPAGALSPLTHIPSPLSPPTSHGALSPLSGSIADVPPPFSDFGVSIDPANSFILPTLDFSSAFEAASGHATDIFESELEYLSDPESLSDVSSDGGMSWVEADSAAAGVPQHRWMFSSAFEQRLQEPMEEMF